MNASVTDPSLLAELNSDQGSPAPPSDPSADAVKDPKILKELNGVEPAVPPPENPEAENDPLKGMGEMAIGTMAGVAGDILGGWGALQDTLTNALGITNKDPTKTVKGFQDALTYTPTNKPPAVVQNLATFVGSSIDKMRNGLGDWAMDETNSPLIASVYYTMPDALATILGAKAPGAAAEAATRGAAKVAERAVMDAGKDQAMKTAVRHGFKLPPSDAGGALGRTLEGLSGQKKLLEEISRDNQTSVNRLTRLDLGMAPDAPLDDVGFRTYRFTQAQPYDQARMLPRIQTDLQFLQDLSDSGKRFQSIERDIPAAVPNEIHQERGKWAVKEMDPDTALQAMSQLREDSSIMFRSDDTVDRHVGSVKRDISAAFESLLERHAIANGKPEWAAQFSQARKNIAKSHTYEDATNLVTQNVSARKVMAARDLGTPLAGEQKTIADTVQAFPRVFQDIDKKGHNSPFSLFDYFVAVGTATHGMMAHESAAGAMGATAAAVGARTGARKMIRSGAYQKKFTKPQSHTQGITGQVVGALGDTDSAATVGAISGAEAGDSNDD